MGWFVTRARHEDLYARYQLALKATADAREQRDAERAAKHTAIRQFEEADAANVRLAGRNRELAARLADAADPGDAKRLAARFDAVRRALKRYRADDVQQERAISDLKKQLAALATLRVELRQARDHARALERRLAEVQSANQAMYAAAER